MNTERDLKLRSAELRESFDHAFSREPSPSEAETEDVLGVLVGGQRHLLRVCELAAIYRDREITAMPSRAPTLLGIAGFRGSLIAVYDLAMLLGYSRPESSRWIVQVHGRDVGFAFEVFVGYYRVPSSRFAAEESPVAGATEQVCAQIDGVLHTVIDVGALVERLDRQTETRQEA